MDTQALTQNSSTAAEPTQIDAFARVYEWRLDQLERAGYSHWHANHLAEDDRIDLHEACDLLRRGCPPRTAFLIMA